LDLSDFVNLEELDCHSNELTELKLDNCLKLKEIRCQDNRLANLDLTNCSQLEILDCNENYLRDLNLPFQNEGITRLDIRKNNLSERDLSMFSHLVNLKELFIGNYQQ